MIHCITLADETDFDGWRDAARTLALSGIEPRDVVWRVKGSAQELFDSPFQIAEPKAAFNVPARFVKHAEVAILHRNPERFALLYRLLWRLLSRPALLAIATDPDVADLLAMVKSVRREEHKMHAFVRFREVKGAEGSHYIAWFEPEHHVLKAAAPFFVRRFTDMRWSILTPDLCVHWDGHAVSTTPGVSKADAPTQDRLEETWRSYYASIFNPARLKVKAMQAEMPKRYWRNLPETSLIKPLVANAERRASEMIAGAASEPHRPQRRQKSQISPKLPAGVGTEMLLEQAADCRACPLWKDATQTVFGEGPPNAEIMLLGEQPGDREDLAGKPFVGPAGQLLDRALGEAGIERSKVYITNAVKHFKFVQRGKIRLHQKPTGAEIRACRPWFERELAAVGPKLVVAMGGTAAQAALGNVGPISKSRGRLFDLDAHTKIGVTVHPSYLLRLPDIAAKTREYALFVQDLRRLTSSL